MTTRFRFSLGMLRLWPLAGLVVASVFATAAAAESSRFAGGPIASELAIDSALQRAARKFFRADTGELLRLKRLSGYSAPKAGAEFHRYEASAPDGRILGWFLRMVVAASENTTFDLALRLEGGRLIAVEPLRPVVIAGRSMFALPEVLAALQDHRVTDWAGLSARFLGALAQVPRWSQGSDGAPRLTEAQTRFLRQVVKAAKPSLPKGTPMPPFSIPEEKGGLVTPQRFTGKRSLILVGRVESEKTRQLLEWLRRYDSSRPGRFLLAEVMADSPEELEQFTLRGGSFDGILATDPDAALRRALRVVLIPSLFVFDRATRLLAHLEPPFGTFESLEAELDSVE